MEISSTQLVILLLSMPIGMLVLYLLKNIKRIGDIWNLRFRKARTVRADMHTQSSRVLTRYVVPDSRGLFRHMSGVYHFPHEGYEIDAKYGIPKADFLEGQIASEDGKIAYSEHTIDGIKIPTLMVNHAKLRPKLLKLARRNDQGKVVITDEPPVTALEIADALDSKIVQDVTNASLADLQMGRIFIVTLIVLGVCVLGFFAIYSQVAGTQEALTALRAGVP